MHDASERFVNIEAPSPFSRQVDAEEEDEDRDEPDEEGEGDDNAEDREEENNDVVSTPPNAHPRMRTSSSAWRPSLDDDDEERDPSVKIVHLGTHFEPYSRASGRGPKSAKEQGRGRARPTSAHSMKTLPRGASAGGMAPSPLRPRHSEDGQELGSEQSEEEVESRYATVASYRTARENEGSEESAAATFKGKTTGKRSASGKSGRLQEMWDEEDAGSESARRDEVSSRALPARSCLLILNAGQLKAALASLEKSMVDFKLRPVGPIVVDLGDDTSR